MKCHGGEKTKSEFDLTTREGLLKGGAEGPAVKLYDAKSSRLYELITHAQDPHMPSKGAKLPDDAISQIAAWIDHGARYDRPLNPSTEGAILVQTFWEAGLICNQLHRPAPASCEIWVRRRSNRRGEDF